jgi:cytochrome c-type biogenesis protein
MLSAHNAPQQYMNGSEKSRGTIIVKKICGILVLIAGLYLIYITN